MQKSSCRRNRPHAYYKNWTYLQIPKILTKFGYDYNNNKNELMSELR
jgi:hypothetical protein